MRNGFTLNNSIQRTKAMTMINLPDLLHNALFYRYLEKFVLPLIVILF